MKLWMVLCAFVLLVGYVFHCAFQADKRAAADDRVWQEYSKTNHCRIIRQDSFAHPKSLWQCDNFQIEH